MKEILQAIKDMQKDTSVKDGETALMIPSLERLVNVSFISLIRLLKGFHFHSLLYKI